MAFSNYDHDHCLSMWYQYQNENFLCKWLGLSMAKKKIKLKKLDALSALPNHKKMENLFILINVSNDFKSVDLPNIFYPSNEWNFLS